jgi:hypothetical protein
MYKILLASLVLVPVVESWVCTETCPGFVEDDCRCHDSGAWAMWVCTKKAGVSQAQPWFCSQPSCQCNQLETTSTLAHHAGSGNSSAVRAVPATTPPLVKAPTTDPPCGTACDGAIALSGAAQPSNAAPKVATDAITVESSNLNHLQRAFLASSPHLRQPVQRPAAVLLGISVFAAMVSFVSFCRGSRSQQQEAQSYLGTMRESQE